MTTAFILVGLPASGKSTALDAIAEIGMPALETSNVARWKFEQLMGRPPTGNDLRHFGDEQRKIHGQGVFGRFTVAYLEERLDDPEMVAISGFRSPGEIEAIEEWADDTHVLAVNATREERLSRVRNRGREHEEGFKMADLEERDDQERDWGVTKCIYRANITIQNTERTQTEFERLVQDYVLEEVEVAA